jgi:translation initiation factor IF-3
LVAAAAKPPVCRISNYGKLKYEIRKKEKEARKSSAHGGVIKELKLTPKTSEHDIQVRLNHSREFLKKKFKVKLEVKFRGREVTHPEIARNLLTRIAQELSDIGMMELPPKKEGRNMYMMLAPK